MPLGVVPGQVFFQCFVECLRRPLHLVQTLLLKRAVESFDMGVVVRFPDSRVPMLLLDAFDEPFPELRPVVALEHVETEAGALLGLFHEPHGGCRIHPGIRLGVCRP